MVSMRSAGTVELLRLAVGEDAEVTRRVAASPPGIAAGQFPAASLRLQTFWPPSFQTPRLMLRG